MPTKKEKLLGLYLHLLLAVYFVMFAFSVYRLIAKPASSGVNLILVLSFTAVMFVKMLMCWYALADLRRFAILIKLLIWAAIISVLFSVFVFLKFDLSGSFSLLNSAIQLKIAAYIITAFNLLNAVILILLQSAAEKEAYGLQYFSPLQYKTIAALAEVVIFGENEIVPPEDVAHNVDRYFMSFEAKSKWTMAMVVTGLYFYPLLSLKPPLPYLNPDARLEFLKKRFYRDIEKGLLPEFWKVIAQGLIRIAKQMSYIGYYNDKRTFPSVGYVPFSERKDKDERKSKSPVIQSPPLDVKTENDIQGDTIEGDVVIIGSGAGAAIMAKGLVESGRQVLMIERGNHEIPETFTEDEMEMVSRLFQDGAIQAARDFRFTVFQGSCVGGSTTVNNAVCFKIPVPVLDKWIDPSGINAGLDKTGVMASMDKVWKLIGTAYQDPKKVKLNPGGDLFRKGCEALGYNNLPNITDAVNANISGCLGCGYCNIGCSYNKKLSMLTTVLPQIQKDYGKDSLKIVAGCFAEKLNRQGNKINYLECTFNSGRKLKVYGKTFVIAAGAISSSVLLLKSKLGVQNAGKKLAFNVGSQLTAAYPFKVDSYDGLQISHYMKISPDTGYVMESWFNPPMFQSTAMPGWFEDHYNNMRRYDRLACVGILTGSESNAEVTTAGLTGREIIYTPTKKDFDTLLSGIELSGKIMLESGAESVMPNTFKYYEFKNKDELRRLKDLVTDPSQITLGTGHPQGGNIIGHSADTGAISPEFKVYGYDNLYISDASVFPTSLGVNPQLTVMGLADYAVQFVKENKG